MAESKQALTPPIKVVEVNGAAGKREWTDFLLADEDARAFDVMTGTTPIYCQVGNKEIADEFARRINAHDDLVNALRDVVFQKPGDAGAYGRAANLLHRLGVAGAQ